jgi:pimeloyl-ACP methyl ester carboxylesterase
VSAATVVLVHGAFHGGWCWERVVPLLEERGLSVSTVELPTTGAPPGETPGLDDDVAAVGATLDDVAGPKLLVGHSYGGIPVTVAAAGRDDVTRLVYLAAAVPDAGESGAALFEAAGIEAAWLVVEGDRMWADPATAAEVFFADCDRETQREAVARLRPMSTAPHGFPAPAAAWHEIPSTYVVCSQDRALSPDAQRNFLAPRTGETVELPTSHSPFYSQPAALAELLAERT